MPDTPLFLDLTFLRELADDGFLLKLPTRQPNITRRLAGKILPARRAIRLAEHAVELLRLRDDDHAVAESERHMAKTPAYRGGNPAHHGQRAFTMHTQAHNRECYAVAYLEAVAQAEILPT